MFKKSLMMKFKAEGKKKCFFTKNEQTIVNFQKGGLLLDRIEVDSPHFYPERNVKKNEQEVFACSCKKQDSDFRISLEQFLGKLIVVPKKKSLNQQKVQSFVCERVCLFLF